MAKKRTSLDSLLETTKEVLNVNTEPGESGSKMKPIRQTSEKTSSQIAPRNERKTIAVAGNKSEPIKQTVYLPPAVHEQLRQLAFEERKKMHDYLVEGLDRVFKNRGLKPYNDLPGTGSRQ